MTVLFIKKLYGVPVNKYVDEDELPEFQKQIKTFLSLDIQNRKAALIKIFKRDKEKVMDIESLSAKLDMVSITCQPSSH
jgi:hypothetical protein